MSFGNRYSALGLGVLCAYLSAKGGGKLPFPCSFASHHCKIWHYNPAEEEEGVGSADPPRTCAQERLPPRLERTRLEQVASTRSAATARRPPQRDARRHRHPHRWHRHQLSCGLDSTSVGSHSTSSRMPTSACSARARRSASTAMAANTDESIKCSEQRGRETRYRDYPSRRRRATAHDCRVLWLPNL